VREIIGLDIEKVACRGLGDDERMTGSARHDIEKGERPVVFIDLVASTANDGSMADNVKSGSYTYKVCASGTSTCTNQVSVTF
jgi:hypothetical protein